jgi:hypothetical protein
LHRLVRKALAKTAAQWPQLQRVYAWVRRAAVILTNQCEEPAEVVQQRYAGLLGAMTHAVSDTHTYRDALQHFLKVTRSYWSGLFHCYAVADLPRTNNDLEHEFGSYRYHERRASGRKVASAGAVVRGTVRIVAATATRHKCRQADDLIPIELTAWRKLRSELQDRRRPRTLGRRFRRDPEGYLRGIEDELFKAILPS